LFTCEIAQQVLQGSPYPAQDILAPILVSAGLIVVQELDRLEGWMAEQRDVTGRYSRLLEDFDNLQDEYMRLQAQLAARARKQQ
jgi:hypothetical protein